MWRPELGSPAQPRITGSAYAFSQQYCSGFPAGWHAGFLTRPPVLVYIIHPPTYLPALPCPPHTQELGKTNPAMLEAINGNQEEFLAMINEPLGEGEGGMEALVQQLAGEMGDGERGGGGRWGVG